MPKPNFPHEEHDPDFDNFEDDAPSHMNGADEDVDLPEPQEAELDDADIEVSVVDDTPEGDRDRPPREREVAEPTEEELQSYGEKVRARINDLTQARHDERRRREALERQQQAALEHARRLQAENERLKQFVTDGSKQFVDATTAAAEAKVAAARRALKEASETFDAEAMAKAQEDLTDAKLELQAAKNFKTPTFQAPENDVQTRQAAEPAEVDPKTRAWMAKRTWFTNPAHTAATSYALGLHQELMAAGYDPQTDRYFDAIDAGMKKRFPELYAGEREPGDRPQRRTGAVVAPASRTAPRKNTVTLTASEVALCQKLGITPKQYAEQKLKDSKVKGA